MEATATMSTITSAISSVFTAAIGMVSTVASTVMDTPILLFFAVLGVVGIGIGIFKRLLQVN